MATIERADNQDFLSELDRIRQLIQRYPDTHAEKPLTKEQIRELWYQEWQERRAGSLHELTNAKACKLPMPPDSKDD